MLGFTGAHRTGKSTLAQALAKAKGVQFLDSQTSNIFERLGFRVGQPLTFEARMTVQRAILEEFEGRYRAARGPFVADRTPIDMAAYVMADMPKHKLTEAQTEAALAYVDECLDITSTYFLDVVLVSPGIPYKEEPGKPPFDRSYQELHHTLVSGLLMDDAVTCQPHCIGRDLVEMQERLQIAMSIWDIAVTKTEEAVASQVLH